MYGNGNSYYSSWIRLTRVTMTVGWHAAIRDYVSLAIADAAISRCFSRYWPLPAEAAYGN